MFASFHVVGYVPDCRDLLNNLVNGSAIIIATSLRILEGKRSGPHDLFMASLLSALSVSCVVIVNSLSVDVVLGCVGWGMLLSGMVV